MKITSIYRKRWQWWPPWETTEWWKTRLDHGSDEYGNPSIYFIVPPLGTFVIFYGRKVDRSEEAFLREERRFQEENLGVTVMMTKRTKEEINEQINRCYDEAGNDITNRWPGMSYEQGVVATLDWITGQTDDAPIFVEGDFEVPMEEVPMEYE